MATDEIGLTETEQPKPDSGRRLVRGSALLFVGRLISILSRFITQVLIVRNLSRTDYGAFAYGLAVISPIQSFMTLGLDRSISRFVTIYHEHEDRRRLLGTIFMAMIVILSLALVVTVGLYGFQGPLAKIVKDPQSLSLLLVMIFLAPIQAFDDLLINLFAVFGKPREIFFRRYVLAPVLRLAVVVGFILTGSSVFFIAVGYMLSSLLGLGIYGWLFVDELRKRGLLADWSLRKLILPWRSVLSFSIPVLTTELVSMNTMSVMLLGYYWGPSNVAGFRAVFPASKLTELVTSSFTTLYLPIASRMFAQNDRAGINHLFWRTAIWITIVSFPIFAATFSLAHPITVLLYGKRYEQSAPILAMLSLGYYFNSAIGFNSLTLQVFGKARAILLLNLSTVVLNLLLSLLLVPRFGAMGAGIATMVAVIVYNLVTQVTMYVGTGVGTIEWRYTRVYLVIAAAALGLLGIQVFLSPPVYVSIALAAAVALFVVCVNREALEVEQMFPEVARVPVLSWLLLGQSARRGPREVRSAVPPNEPR